jgi:hypothetical protein
VKFNGDNLKSFNARKIVCLLCTQGLVDLRINSVAGESFLNEGPRQSGGDPTLVLLLGLRFRALLLFNLVGCHEADVELHKGRRTLWALGLVIYYNTQTCGRDAYVPHKFSQLLAFTWALVLTYNRISVFPLRRRTRLLAPLEIPPPPLARRRRRRKILRLL